MRVRASCRELVQPCRWLLARALLPAVAAELPAAFLPQLP
jgi:hypothetical protein